jgi:hypothetical protein
MPLTWGLSPWPGGHAGAMATSETARDRRQLATDAGHRSLSPVSILAGTLVAFGFVTVVTALFGAVGSQLGLHADGMSTDDWREAGMGAAAVTILVLGAAFAFGGYTAGRMARRAGMRQGLGVFVLAVAVMGLIALVAAIWGDLGEVTDELADRGVPTALDTWDDIGLIAAIAAAMAMLIGSILGGIRGDRWHGHLLTAAEQRRSEAVAVPASGPEAHGYVERDDWKSGDAGDPQPEPAARERVDATSSDATPEHVRH